MTSVESALFANPPKQFRPMVRWWWPGLDVERDELLAEIRDMDEAGFAGAEIQTFMIGAPSDLAKHDRARFDRAHRFMQPYYYQMVQAVLDEAATRGMTIDLTICSAWPAGGTHITPENMLKTLGMGAKIVRGPKLFRGALPRCAKPLVAYIPKQVPLLGAVASWNPGQLELLRVLAAKPLGRGASIRGAPRRASSTSARYATSLPLWMPRAGCSGRCPRAPGRSSRSTLGHPARTPCSMPGSSPMLSAMCWIT